MAFCSECGLKLDSEAKFCSGCGKSVNGGDDGSQRKHVFEGSIHKCPNCGEAIGSFTSVCSSCGFEFRNTKSSSAVKEFSQKLEKIEAGRKPQNTIIKTLGFKNTDTTDEQVLNLIRNFTVPNTKEDVFEFMILASSNINTAAISADNVSDAGANSNEELNVFRARNDAWIAKVEQVYEKAKLSFGMDQDFSKIQVIYEKATSSIQKANKLKNINATKRWLPLAIMAALCISYFAGVGISHISKENKLEETVQEIQIDMSNGNYDMALIKANSLHMDDGWSDESEAHWDEQREYLIAMIEKAMEGK